MPRGHAVLARLAEASRDIWTAAGFIEEGAAAQIYNSQAVLRDGSVAFVHRKLNLATYGRLEEGKHFAAGRFLQPFDQIGRAHVRTTVTNAHLVCRLLLEKKNIPQQHNNNPQTPDRKNT